MTFKPFSPKPATPATLLQKPLSRWHKKRIGDSARATPSATPATNRGGVATVATVAVAPKPQTRMRDADKCFLADKLATEKHLEAAAVEGAAAPPTLSPDDDAAIAFAERQAICEISGGLSRAHAALLALASTVPLAPHETTESRYATVDHLARHFDAIRRQKNGGGA